MGVSNRKQRVLSAIIDSFINSAVPVGSEYILKNYNFEVSSATIRNEMMGLEKEGLIYQPHTSAGRVPTQDGYRMFIDELMDIEDNLRAETRKKFDLEKKKYLLNKTKETIYDIIAILASATNDVSFATVPDTKRTFYLGISNILRQPEFRSPSAASKVIQVLEENFYDILMKLDINKNIKIFIGEENLIPSISSCSLLATIYNINGYKGVIGVLGPMRMDYAYNSVMLEYAAAESR